MQLCGPVANSLGCDITLEALMFSDHATAVPTVASVTLPASITFPSAPGGVDARFQLLVAPKAIVDCARGPKGRRLCQVYLL